MKTILPKHPRFANPTQWRKMRNPSGRMLRRALQKGEVATPGTFLDWLQKRMRRTPARPRPVVTQYRTRIRARIRARRSPASTRRATTDSGGDSDGGDPEPPRPSLSYSLPTRRDGGAL